MNELSNIAWKFRNKVKYSKVAPYKIKNSWWLISGSICRKCCKEEATTAEQLWTSFNKMDAASYEPNATETAELKELYDKVQGMDVMYEDSTHADAMESLGNLLQSLTEPEIEELIEQWNMMPVLIDYADGCSYRHRGKNPA